MLSLSARRGRFLYLILIVPAAMIVAGFLVPGGRTTEEGVRLNVFLWGMGLFWLVTDVALLLFLRFRQLGSLRARDGWVEATGEVLSVSRSSIPVRGRPVAVLTLLVHPPGGPPVEVRHRQPFDQHVLAGLYTGASVELRIDPDNPKDLVVV